MTDIPPLPEGFTLDQPQAAAGVPPLPPGFTLDQQPTDAPPSTDPNADKSVLGELGHSAWQSVAQVGQGVANLIDNYGPAPSSPEEVAARQQRRAATSDQYNNLMSQGPAVPSWDDVKNGHDLSLYVANKLGGVSPYALTMGLGFLPAASGAVVPAMASTGALQGGEQEAEQPNSTPASVATAAGLGGAMGAAKVPFLSGEGGVLSRLAKGALLGGPILGAAQGATQNIPKAVETGNPEDALPDASSIREAMIGNSIGMGALGGVHAAGERALGRLNGGTPDAPTPETNANARLAQRIQDAADQNGYNLKNVDYGAPDGAKAALDTVHNTLAEDVKGVWDVLKGDLDPTRAADVGELLDRTGIAGSMRSARNKVKGDVGTDDLARLNDAVGHTEEGRVLLDLVRQSNQLSTLFRQGLKGGVSRFTDAFNPLGHGGRETGYRSAVGDTGRKLLEGLAVFHNPAVAVPTMAGIVGAGRGIDALTGRRSTVARFVSDNSRVAPQPIDQSGASSVLRDRAQAEAQGIFQRLQAQHDRAMQQAQAAQQRQQQQFSRMQAQHDRTMQRAQDADARRQQQLQDKAEQDRLLQRESELRTQNRLDNNPGLGGFDRSIYDQTGIRPADAVPGVFELFRTGRVSPDEFHAFFDSPRDLMQGNAGNHIIDMLDQLARNGTVQRDPEWQPQQAGGASLRPDQPQVSSIRNRAAYEAQAAGNQSRVTEAQARVAASPHPPELKQAISEAIATIGRTNNRADARAVRDNAVLSLKQHPEAQALASQELDPLVQQIRHEGTAKADATTGNAETRALADAYKLKAGVKKPAYGGREEPSEGYLRSIADFHDKAVHSPDDPAVKASYDALIRETVEQYKTLGDLKVETWRGEGEPYRNSKEMMRDVAENQHLWFLPTENAFGSNGEEIAHPMLAQTGLKTADGHPLLANDVFRIVHDFFGHTQHGFQFGPVGEYNAYREHAQMYSDAALPALAAETLAQNAWVNFGPHLRGPRGDIPKQGEPGYLSQTQRPFSDQKAYAVSSDLLSHDPNFVTRKTAEASSPKRLLQTKLAVNTALSSTPALYNRLGNGLFAPEGKRFKDGGALKPKTPADLHDLFPGLKGITPFLTPSEREMVTKRNAQTLIDAFDKLPSAAEMASVAYSGRAKRGWYHNSANAIAHIFGVNDAPRFTALLAATSPQTSVESNLTNALNIWAGWVDAGRPKDNASILRIMGENVQGNKGQDSILDAWVNNSLRALQAPDGERVTISGPKVASFSANLLHEVNEVTNDAWMANYANVDQEMFKGREKARDEIGTIAGKTPGYMAMSALARKSAQAATKLTGSNQPWTPAEVQETVWSWAKALYEKADANTSAHDIVKQQSLTHGEINSVPDFERLFVQEAYRRILEKAGYGEQIASLSSRGASSDALDGPGGSPFSTEGTRISPVSHLQHLARAAKRLDSLRANRTKP